MGTGFNRYTAADVRDLIAEYPLAWVTAPGGAASLLPLLGEYAADGTLLRLLGHMARGNPLVTALGLVPRATILFAGPHGYVSPDHAGKRDWGPTWNFVELAITADLVFLPEATGEALDTLVDAMEHGRWTSAELGARYDGMAAAVIAFRAHVVSMNGRFKLGQDESRPVFESIVRRHPDAALVRWMQRFDRP
jgi:transcriptional regulator